MQTMPNPNNSPINIAMSIVWCRYSSQSPPIRWLMIWIQWKSEFVRKVPATRRSVRCFKVFPPRRLLLWAIMGPINLQFTRLCQLRKRVPSIATLVSYDWAWRQVCTYLWLYGCWGRCLSICSVWLYELSKRLVLSSWSNAFAMALTDETINGHLSPVYLFWIPWTESCFIEVQE